MDEETEKRDQFIYELIANRFRLEWQRTSDLDGKASGIIGFVGIIVSLQAGLGGFILKEISRTSECYALLCFLFLSGIVLLMCSILCGLKAYYVKAWKVVPDPEYLIEEYAKKDRSRIDILRIVSAEISDAVTKNKTTNDEKAKFIGYGFIFLVLGIGMVIIFVCGLLLV
jgi:O-antigen/teichoic acid export membrane protein